jgi:hypothetical protein
MVSTPRSELDRDVVEDEGDSKPDCIIDIGDLGLEVGEWGLVVYGGVLPDTIVVVDITGSLVE